MTDALTALRDLVAAVTPLVDPRSDLVTPTWTAWEFNTYAEGQPDGEELHEALVEAHGAAVAAVEREKDHPPCGARTVFWPDDEAIDAECVLPAGHYPFNVHRDEDLDEWDESERMYCRGGWGPR